MPESLAGAFASGFTGAILDPVGVPPYSMGPTTNAGRTTDAWMLDQTCSVWQTAPLA